MPHLIAIFCRIKCFNSDNSLVKDFLFRYIALTLSCDDFNRFEEILLLSLTLTINRYNGMILGSAIPSPAENARLKLSTYIADEQHEAMQLVPDKNSGEYQKTVF